VPPRAGAVLSETGKTAPTQRDRHITAIAEHGRMKWRKESGYNLRARAEAHIGRFKAVIGDSLRSRTPSSRDAEIAIAANALNKMLGFGRPESVRIA
jgi:hypothetical protein